MSTNFYLYLCIMSIITFRQEFIKLLLLMEVAMLMVFVNLFSSLSNNYPSSMSTLSLIMFILVMGAIEASLGLSMAVMMTRSSKMDMMDFSKML
uniref:NADH-ubiquinone oxidoreductase chain 4L n=1 Tax=Membranipora grandicella TaxID=192923 RepID=I6M194_9BILA|nr:NADH dehydrogenase subunit 4L [Membranipora grandicella]AEH99603.1 NADH dehydrogenase subunit 4L [Membranipora grandicella]